MMQLLIFRRFATPDVTRCLALLDGNTPEFFSPNERVEYASFLERSPAEYEVCELDGRLAGAFGLISSGPGQARLHWILIDRECHGRGIGSAIMSRVAEHARASGVRVIAIAASHRSAPFFAKHGAVLLRETADGWGPGMHRVDMELRLRNHPGASG